jgi:hypothetical protein
MAGRWFSPCTPVSSTNKTDRHNITEILLTVALYTIKQTFYLSLTLHFILKIPTNAAFYKFLHKNVGGSGA